MLIDILNMVQRNKQAKRSGRPEEHQRRVTPVGNWGGSRIRNTVASGVSMLAGLIEAKKDFGELPRIEDTGGADPLTSTIDNIQDPNARQRAIAAEGVYKGEKYREVIPTYYSFFNDKSVMPNNNFTVSFGMGDPGGTKTTNGEESERDGTEERNKMLIAYGEMPLIEKWHVKSVSVDLLPAEVKVEKQFNYAFPAIDIKDMNHKFTVTLQEDKIGTVFTFIQWAYAKMIDASGIHYSQANNRIGWCRVSILNPYTLIITEILFQDIFITNAGQLSLDYGNDGIVEYPLEFQAASRLVRTVPIARKDEIGLLNDQLESLTTYTGLFESNLKREK